MFINVQCRHYATIIKHFATGITEGFLTVILDDPKNKCLLYTNSSVEEPVGFVVYRITKTRNETRFYMLLLAVHPEQQSVGYGSMIISDLAHQYRTIMNDTRSKTIRVVIHSTRDNARFYYHNGFRRTRTNYIYRTIYKYEQYDQTDFVMTRMVGV